MKVIELIDRGVLISPITKKTLHLSSGKTELVSTDNQDHFVFHNETPLLLADKEQMIAYSQSSERMNLLYSEEYLQKEYRGFFGKIWLFISKDYRTESSEVAFSKAIDDVNDNNICISIGGGPHRKHSKLLNVNIAPFANVDLVADAHNMPFADNVVDFIECEAVIEHLYNPAQAASEMYRISKKGAKIFIIIPFLQQYHGFPHHYQNFTLTGSCDLFKRAGFKIIESGTCVGPSYVIAHLNCAYLQNYMPKIIGKPLSLLWLGLASLLLKPLDIWVNKNKDSHVLASTTYLVAEK